MAMPENDENIGSKEAEQIQLARDIAAELTEGFVAFVRGRVAFDELTFGVYDALHDLAVVASGDYDLEELDDAHDHDHHNNHDDVTGEQEDLAQEPARDARE